MTSGGGGGQELKLSNTALSSASSITSVGVEKGCGVEEYMESSGSDSVGKSMWWSGVVPRSSP